MSHAGPAVVVPCDRDTRVIVACQVTAEPAQGELRAGRQTAAPGQPRRADSHCGGR